MSARDRVNVPPERQQLVQAWLRAAADLLAEVKEQWLGHLLEAAPRAGEHELAVEVALRAKAGVGRYVGAGRYENEGITWIGSPDPRVPSADQFQAALERAAVAGRLADLRVLAPLVPEQPRRVALSRLGERPLPQEDLVPAGEFARDHGAAPENLIEQLAAAGHAVLGLAIADAAVGTLPMWSHNPAGPLGSVAAGLAARGEFTAAIAVADRCPSSWARGEAIHVAARAWVAHHGPDGVDRFVALLRRGDTRPKGMIPGYVAMWRAERADAGVIDDLARFKGFARFNVQWYAVRGFLQGGQLELAERMALLAGPGSTSQELEDVAVAWAKAGDLDRAVSIALRTRGEPRSLAWEGIVYALADAGRHDEAEAFASEHVTARWLRGSLARHLAWARAYEGDPDPFPRRLKPRDAAHRFDMLIAAALGAHWVDPYTAEVYLGLREFPAPQPPAVSEPPDRRSSMSGDPA